MHKITAKSRFVSRTDLAKWIYSLMVHRNDPGRSLPRSMQFTDELICGGHFEWYLSANEVLTGAALCNIEEVVYDNPYAAHFRQQEEYHELMLKGAAGDAEAAIAYCKLEAEYKVSHAAMG